MAFAMATSDGSLLTLERVLPAPRPAVWEAMTNARQLAQWWGPAGFSIPEIEFDPSVGAEYRITMQPPEGEPFHLNGEFREVDPPSRLSFTFNWEPPDPDDRETLAEVRLIDKGGSTEVQFSQGRFATEERRSLHDGGWTDSFEKLERLLAS
jgi:uncharacterized protein YndB with AHSA1/START domain